MYWLNYLDRNAIALAKLNGIQKDLNLSGTQYQTCVSILFVGYILGQIPSNMLLTRVRPSYYMVCTMGFRVRWAHQPANMSHSQQQWVFGPSLVP